MSNPERFWPKVARQEGQGCWLWTASCRKDGYGQFHIRQGKMVAAHRVAWELEHGPIPIGLSVLHQCDTPRCVRPSHLFLGTLADNMRDMVSKGRKLRLYGSRTSNARLNEATVRQIRRRWATGAWTVTDLAKRFGVSHPTISLIVHRKTWTHI